MSGVFAEAIDGVGLDGETFVNQKTESIGCESVVWRKFAFQYLLGYPGREQLHILPHLLYHLFL